MSKECSIYFDNRKIVLTKSIEKYFNNQLGLFIRYGTLQELSKILDFFQSTNQVENVFISGDSIRTMLDDILRHYKVIVAAGGLVQNSKGEFLFIFRNGRWDLPKGKLEPEEKIEDAALREVSEETGISKLKLRDYIVDTYHVYNLGNSTILKVSHWFNMTCKGNEPLVPQLNENITMAKWIPKEQLDEILQNTYDTIREVFRDAGIT